MLLISSHCGAVAQADGTGVVSSDVVGYMEVTRPAAYQNSGAGSMFLSVGGDGYTLADFTISGPASKANARNNYIMFMQTGAAAKIDKNRSYYYFGGTWFVRSGANFMTDPSVADPSAVSINPGEGFLCNFAHATTKIMYAGRVITGGASKELAVSRPDGYQIFVASNPSASEIDLSQIALSGPTSKANARNNYIMFMQTGSAAKIDKNRSYYYFGGTWYIRSGTNFMNDPTLTDPSSVKIAAGEGFLCNFAHTTTSLTLPTSL